MRYHLVISLSHEMIIFKIIWLISLINKTDILEEDAFLGF